MNSTAPSASPTGPSASPTGLGEGIVDQLRSYRIFSQITTPGVKPGFSIFDIVLTVIFACVLAKIINQGTVSTLLVVAVSGVLIHYLLGVNTQLGGLLGLNSYKLAKNGEKR